LTPILFRDDETANDDPRPLNRPTKTWAAPRVATFSTRNDGLAQAFRHVVIGMLTLATPDQVRP